MLEGPRLADGWGRGPTFSRRAPELASFASQARLRDAEELAIAASGLPRPANRSRATAARAVGRPVRRS